MTEETGVDTPPQSAASTGGDDDGAPVLVAEEDGNVQNDESLATPPSAPVTPLPKDGTDGAVFWLHRDGPAVVATDGVTPPTVT